MTRSSIIIPVCNHAAVTEQCLQSLEPGDCEVIVVDDASTDQTPKLLASMADRLKTVTHSVNEGFATCCNDGASVASGEFLVFLNNDTIPSPGWLTALTDYAQTHPQVAVVGSKLLYPDNTVQHAGVVICQDYYPRHIYAGFPADHPAVNRSRPFQIVTAACMLVRRSAFNLHAGFDACFRNGFEDVDFCLRLGRTGCEIHYCAESVVQHLESISPGRFKHAGANVALYREKWFGRVKSDDMKYYLEDGLLELSYEGVFPISLKVDPRLAVLETAYRSCESEQLLREYSQQIADLRRENTRLSLHLAGALPESEEARYHKLRQRIQEMIQQQTRPGTIIVVVSKGDRALLECEGRQAWHFPQTSKGAYAGSHPADSFTAITQLEGLRRKGADYLVFPKTAFWWLEHYRELERHLTNAYRVAGYDPEICKIFELRVPLGEPFQRAEPNLDPLEERGETSMQITKNPTARQAEVPQPTGDA